MCPLKRLNLCNDLIYKIAVDSKSRKFVSHIFKATKEQPACSHIQNGILKDYVTKINSLSFLHVYRIVLRLEAMERRDLLLQIKNTLNALTKKRILLYILRKNTFIRPILSECLFQFNTRTGIWNAGDKRNSFWSIWNLSIDEF